MLCRHLSLNVSNFPALSDAELFLMKKHGNDPYNTETHHS